MNNLPKGRARDADEDAGEEVETAVVLVEPWTTWRSTLKMGAEICLVVLESYT